MSQQIVAEPSENWKQLLQEHRMVELEEEAPSETAGRVKFPSIRAG